MGIEARCPNPACAKKMTVGAAYAGRRLHCPVCGAEFVVAGPSDQDAGKQSALWAPLLGEFVAGPSSKEQPPEETHSKSGTKKKLTPLNAAWEALDVESLIARERKSRSVDDQKAAAKKKTAIKSPTSTSEPPTIVPQQRVLGSAKVTRKPARFWIMVIGGAGCLGLLVVGLLLISRPDPGRAIDRGNEQPPIAARHPAPRFVSRKDADQGQTAAPLPKGAVLFQQASPAVVRLDIWDSKLNQTGSGSAFCVSEECALVTNAHVIQDADLILAHNERTAFFVTELAAVDSQADLAVLKAPSGSLPKLEMADGKPPSVGTDVYAIGSPLGLTNVFSQGIISAYHQRGDMGLMQMTAQISSGSSGGPVLGPDGKVLAVTTAYLAGGQNLNFAVPAARVRLLLDRPGKVQVLRTDVQRAGPSGLTLLHYAAGEGSVPVIELLLRKGANTNARDSKGDTPLHRAIERGHVQTVKRLIADGADVNARGDTGWTPLHYAARNGSSDIARILIEKGAQVLAKEDLFGMSPLHSAAWHGKKDVGQVILAAGVAIDLKDESDHTPLHCAANANQRELVEWLIEKGADINAKTRSGITPVGLAIRYGHSELESRLRQLGGRE